MWKISIAVILMSAEIIAADFCDRSIQHYCTTRNAPRFFPETSEALQEVCEFAIGFFECGVSYMEECGPVSNPEREEEARELLRIFRDICNEDAPLYAAVVENLKCFSDLVYKDQYSHCTTQINSPSVAYYLEVLKEEGHVSLTDDENDIDNTKVCIRSLLEFSCIGTVMERECGTSASETFVELLKKFDTVFQCAGKLDLLPAVIRLYKMEQEEREKIATDLIKRK